MVAAAVEFAMSVCRLRTSELTARYCDSMSTRCDEFSSAVCLALADAAWELAASAFRRAIANCCCASCDKTARLPVSSPRAASSFVSAVKVTSTPLTSGEMIVDCSLPRTSSTGTPSAAETDVAVASDARSLRKSACAGPREITTKSSGDPLRACATSTSPCASYCVALPFVRSPATRTPASIGVTIRRTSQRPFR